MYLSFLFCSLDFLVFVRFQVLCPRFGHATPQFHGLLHSSWFISFASSSAASNSDASIKCSGTTGNAPLSRRWLSAVRLVTFKSFESPAAAPASTYTPVSSTKCLPTTARRRISPATWHAWSAKPAAYGQPSVCGHVGNERHNRPAWSSVGSKRSCSRSTVRSKERKS
jgi:hypothetical protein